MKKLQLFNVDSIDNIVSPENFEQTTLASSAKNIFTDFKDHKPLIIDGETTAVEALNLMQKAHVQMKIVVSKDEDFIGVISTKELTEQRIVAEIAKGNERHEILVSELMHPRDTLHAFDFNELTTASVNDVVTALENYGLRHCLVLDREHHNIRGLISSSDIARKLHLPIDIQTKTSFSQIFKVIHG
ncbi:MAG: CBS domain-containing protein [Colwellia sp.]|nr:CBS domain-containing protein [Colwellia sp.]